jgi:hypothetical protein
MPLRGYVHSSRNERRRSLDPSSEEPCGSLTSVPTGHTDENVYCYWYSAFQSQCEVICFDQSGKIVASIA